MATGKETSFLINKLLIVTIGLTLFVFLIMFSYQSFTYDIESVLKKSKTEYILFSSLVKTINLLPYILSFSVIFNFCLIYSIGLRKGKNELQENDYIASFFIFLIICFLFVTILNEALLPFLNLKVSQILITTKLSYQYLKKAKEYELSKQYTLALEYYKRYLTFEPKNMDIIDLVAELERKKYSEIPKPSPLPTFSSPPVNAASLYNLALYHTKMKEYVLAIYYLERYLLLNPTDSNARSLYDKVKSIYENEVMTKKEDALYIMKQKRLGISYLQEKKYVEAYNLFLALSRKYPNDKSIKPYLEEAINLYRKVDFFVADALEKKDYPGLNSALFKLKDAKREGVSYLIFIDKVVYYFDQIYLFDVYLYNLSSKTSYYYKYGKKVQNYFVFKNIDNEHEITYFDIKIQYFKNFILLRSFNLFPLYSVFDLKNFIVSLGYMPSLFTDYLKQKILFYLSFIFNLMIAFKISLAGMKKNDSQINILQIIFFLAGIFLFSVSIFQFLMIIHNGIFTLFSFTLSPATIFILIFLIDIASWIIIYFI
ncbi:MAG: tetratricopeptide repeat protein [Exilispira sp.]